MLTIVRRRLIAIAAAFAIAAAGTAVAATQIVGPAGVPSETAVRADPQRRTVLIGDSAISALRWVPRADTAIVGFEHTLDLESCRRLYRPSCFGREGRIPSTAYQALGFHGDKYTTLVVATGYNDGSQSFAESFHAIVDRARSLGYDTILWWTMRSDVDYVAPGSIANHMTFAVNNQIVRDLLATGNYPDVILADWGGYTADRVEWFVTDGVHYRAVGTWAASDYLTRKMAFIEGRTCPVPIAPQAEPQSPCPDPDVTGPIADIEALYPIGDDGVLCYEIGQQRRFECRNDTHVIQLSRELAIGMAGSDVAALQTRLIRLDRLDSFANGNFGTLTRSAVIAFQASASIAATGIANVETLDALGFDTSGITTP